MRMPLTANSPREVEISLPEEETSTTTANNEYPSCTGVISQCTDYKQRIINHLNCRNTYWAK